MASNTELIDRYIAIWNETNAQRREELIARTWTEDAVYLDPMMHGEGRRGIDVMIEGVQRQFPARDFVTAPPSMRTTIDCGSLDEDEGTRRLSEDVSIGFRFMHAVGGSGYANSWSEG